MRNIVFVLLLFCSLAHAAVFLVAPGESIQETVNTAQELDTVLIADGVYEESVVLHGKTLTIASYFLMDGDTSHIGNTIIRPANQNADTASCLIYSYGESIEGRAVGLSLTDGRGTTSFVPPNQKVGGCIQIQYSAVTVQHCRIANGRAYAGGGIFVEGNINAIESASVVLENVTISNCFADWGGGGCYMLWASAYISDCIFEHDSSAYLDGGLLCDHVHFEIDNCAIRYCWGWIGGMNAVYCNGHVRYSLFEENGARPIDVGQCHFASGSSPIEFSGNIVRNGSTEHIAANFYEAQSPTVVGNVFENNISTYLTGAVLVGWWGGTEFAYNIIRNNLNRLGGALQAYQRTDAYIHHNYFENNRDLAENNGSALACVSSCNPTLDSNLFVNNTGISAGWGFPGETHTLDMRNNWWGHPSGPYHPTYNPTGLGDTLLSDSIFFSPWLTEPPDTTMPTGLDPDPDYPAMPGTWHIMNLFPNPFNSEFTIILAGFTRQDFSIRLYDILGREAAVVHEGALTGGSLTFVAPTDLASGVYFLRALDKQVVDTRKVVFLK